MCMSVGSPVIAKSPPSPRATIASVERSSISSDSSSGTQTSRTRTRSCSATSFSAHIIAASAALHVVGAAADQPVALDPRLELLGSPGTTSRWPWKTTHGGVGSPRPDLGHQHGQPAVIVLGTSMSRDSSQPLTNPAAATSSSGREVS